MLGQFGEYLAATWRFMTRHGRIWWVLLGVLITLVFKFVPLIMMMMAMAGMGPPKPGSFPMPVEVALVKQTDLADTVSVSGALEADKGAVLRSEVTGVIDQLPLQEGALVKTGDLLVLLRDNSELANVSQTQAALSFAQNNYTRLKTLKKEDAGLVAQRDLDNATSQLALAKANLAVAQSALRKKRVSAPFDGTVGLQQVSVGDYVQPGQALVSLQQLDALKVEFSLPERFGPVVAPGDAVELAVDALNGEKFSATVTAVDPMLASGSRGVNVRTEIPNPDGRLRPGMFVRVTATLGQTSNTLNVPEEAIMPEGDNKFVLKVVSGTAVKTQVNTGLHANGMVAVAGELKADDMVISAGQMKVQPGGMVVPMNISAPATTASPTGVK